MAKTAASVPALWVASAIYTAGMVATVNGVAYQANWWTQDNNPVGSSGPSGSGEPWTLVANGVVPAAPAGLAVSGVTSTAATLQWQASAAPANQSITGYAIFENGVQIATSATTTYNAINLTSATIYAFAVAALDAVGPSAESSPCR